MRLIFIRHAQPDYSIDGLTEKGKVEAQLLAKRTASWDVDRFFCSPLGRAKDTAEPTLKALNREATICDWLQEFHYRVEDPYTKDLRVPWDYFPEFFTTQPLMLDPDKWYDCDLYKTNPEIKSKWFEVCNGLDDIIIGMEVVNVLEPGHGELDEVFVVIDHKDRELHGRHIHSSPRSGVLRCEGLAGNVG